MCDHPNREAAMVTVERDESGTPTVWCDPCLVPIVRALNAGGVLTVASCCGHGRIPSTIALGDGRSLTIAPTVFADGKTRASDINAVLSRGGS